MAEKKKKRDGDAKKSNCLYRANQTTAGHICAKNLKQTALMNSTLSV